MRSSNMPKMPENIPMPPIKCMESKIKRIYEDDSWVIDLIDGKVRVSYFENCHFVDDIMISKDTFPFDNEDDYALAKIFKEVK